MENLILEATDKTPVTNFNAATGVLFMSGKSIPENTMKFYQVLIDWFTEYIKNPAPNSVFNIQLEYFNTSSAKRILDLLKLLQTALDAGKTTVQINWTFEDGDTDMEEAGDDFKNMLHIPFEIIGVPADED